MKSALENMRKRLAQPKLLVLASVIAIAIVLTPLLFNLSKSTLFPLSLQPRDWTGIGADSTTNTERDGTGKVIKTVEVAESSKTLWDWLSVLGVPLTLALLGFWFQWLQQEQSKNQAKIERERTEKQSQVDKEIAEINRREEAIQAYLDRLSDLLVDKNLIAIASKVQSIKAKSEPKKENEEVEPTENFQEQEERLDAAVDVIRARTLAILRRLKDDADRKNSVVEFLIKAEVIQKLKLSLEWADLSRANLSDTNLSDANLSRADLSDASLSDTNLSGANLNRAALIRADLSGANLIRADLSGANLSGANLIRADLSGANLSDAILLKVDLSQVKRLNQQQIEESPERSPLPLVCNVKLPEGIKIDTHRDCKELPQVFLKRYPTAFEDLAAAQKYVDEWSKP